MAEHKLSTEEMVELLREIYLSGRPVPPELKGLSRQILELMQQTLDQDPEVFDKLSKPPSE